MKRKLTPILALMLALTLLLPTAVMAADSAPDSTPEVRVNGTLVDFPDGQPYVDAHGRTMIPIRFVAEALGAETAWNATLPGAELRKDGVTLRLPIGCKTMTVTKNGGETQAVEMDTEAVLQNGRTYVPIRFVAEALGCWVSYAKAYQTVELWQDSLTPSEINQLHGLKPTAKGFITLPDLLGNEYENVCEYTYREIRPTLDYSMSYLDKSGTRHSYCSTADSREDFTAYVAGFLREKYSTGAYALNEYGVTETFRTDGSCIYGFPGAGSAFVADGVLTIQAEKNADLTGYRRFNSGNTLLSQLRPGETATFLVEICFQIVVDGNGHGTVAPYLTYNRTGGQCVPIYE